MMIPFVYVDDVLTIVLDSTPITVDRSHPNFSLIKNSLASGDKEKIRKLLETSYDRQAGAIKDFQKASKYVTLDGDTVLYKGEEVRGSIVKRIKQFRENDLPYTPLINFLENLMANPSYNSRQQLYDFLEYSCLVITEDGYILGYKGIREDWKDCRTGKIDNSITGKPVSMDRGAVVDDPNIACGPGLHVGTYKFAKGFGQRMVLVKINPRDVVSVPRDCSCEKMRTCEYLVIAECTESLAKPLYNSDVQPVQPVRADEDSLDWATANYNTKVITQPKVVVTKAKKELRVVKAVGGRWTIVDKNNLGRKYSTYRTRMLARVAVSQM